MQSLAKGWKRSADTGRALPATYKAFDYTKVVFRRSASSMIAGVPGSMKSTLALNLLVKWAREGITGMYFSADADSFVVARNTAAILTSHTVEVVERGMRGRGQAFYSDALSAMDNTRWVYKIDSIEDIDRQMRGFEAVYGKFPDVIVVDNLLNVSDSADDWTACRVFLKDLEALARAAECHAMVLHHTTESGYTPGFPQPRSAIMGKLAQFPRVILMVAPTGGVLNFCVAKSKDGPEYPSGQPFFALNVDAERMTINDSGFFTQDAFNPM